MAVGEDDAGEDKGRLIHPNSIRMITKRQKIALWMTGTGSGVATALFMPLVAKASFVELPSVATMVASTTDWSSPLFVESNKLAYPIVGGVIAVAVIGLIVGVIIRTVKGATRGGRRGRGRRRRR